METKFIHILLILSGIFTQPGFSQKVFTYIDTNKFNTEIPLCGELFAPASLPNIETFLNKNWRQTDIRLIDGKIIRNKKIKYNILLDELFWLEEGSNQIIKLDKEAITQFHFRDFQGDTTVYFRKIKVKKDSFNDSTEIFVQEIYYKNLSLYISHSLYFAGREAVRMGQRYILKDIYKEVPVYYLRFSNNKVEEIKRFGRKNLYKAFPDNKNQIKEYFRNSISGKTKTEQEVISFITFLSSIFDS